MLGLAHGQNRLVNYDNLWPRLFEAERTRLARALEGIAEAIEHYGSTAVPGLMAKPILDILIGVVPLARWQECHDPLLALGYDYAALAGVPGHHIFGRGRDRAERTHLVHVVEFGGPSWVSNLAFRDALRTQPELRAAYESAKQSAVAGAPANRPRYNELKQGFIDQAKKSLSDSGA